MADKKKRGVAGMSNAQNSPWRLNGGGLYPMYMRKIMDSVGKHVTASMGKPPKSDKKED